jgi:hypothetical protein
MTKTVFGGWIVAAAFSGLALAALGCSSNSPGGPLSPAGEVVTGPLDSHCALPDGGQMIQSIGACVGEAPIPNTCGGTITFQAATNAADAAASSDDGGASDYGPTMYGSAGNDDDCKYYVSWIATPIQEKTDTYFTVTAIRLQDMQPARCAGVRVDVFLSSLHGAPPPATEAPEIAAGVYKVGPIQFDQPGQWSVRFHFYEECNDTPDSPHGHAAFYVDVP